MPKLRVTRDHHTTQTSALDILERQVPILLDRFGGNVTDPRWQRTGDTIAFSGESAIGTIKGSVEVSDTSINFSAEIPWAAIPFKGKAEKGVHTWVDELFGPDR